VTARASAVAVDLATPPPVLPLSIDVTLHRPAEIEIHAPLARALLAAGKQRGIRRLWYKAARALFHLVHQRLGRPAAAALRPTGSSAAFTVDCANTGFLDYARRSRSVDGVEPEISGLFSYLAPHLAVVYDIGANWGFYPLLFGTDPCFSGEVHAFEIQSRTVADLRHVIASSGLAGRVQVHAHGLSDHDGAARLAMSRHSYLARIVGDANEGPTEPVPVRRLDGLDLPPPQLIKLDVEGHEAAVLRGGAGLIGRHRPLIVFESWYRPDQPELMLEPLRILAAQGYAFCRLTWRATTARHGTVTLAPLALDQRPAIAEALNLLAVHPARTAAYF
jgi:FkbM family methyltransferase